MASPPQTAAAPSDLPAALGISPPATATATAPAPSPPAAAPSATSPDSAAATAAPSLSLLPAPQTATAAAKPTGVDAFSAGAPALGAGAGGAALLLLALAIAALVGARRRRGGARLVHIVESASLGAKRSLVVARLGDELLVLGTSEGGVSLLATRPASALAPRPRPIAEAAARGELDVAGAGPSGTFGVAAASGLAARLRGLLRRGEAPRARKAAAFESLLTESVEDVELRRKLAAGQPGRAP